jgi:hypothetical protein
MTISDEEVFEKAQEYLKRNYPDARKVTMPYCSFYNDISNRKKYFKVQLNYRREPDTHDKSTVFEVNPDTGNIEMFKENYNWTYWSSQ